MYIKTDFQNSIERLSFLRNTEDIKIASIIPDLLPLTVLLLCGEKLKHQDETLKENLCENVLKVALLSCSEK